MFGGIDKNTYLCRIKLENMKIIKFLVVLALFTIVPYGIGIIVNVPNANHWAIITLIGIAVELVIVQVGAIFTLVLMEFEII